MLPELTHLEHDAVAQAPIRAQGGGVDDLDCRNEAWYIGELCVFEGICEVRFGKVLQEAYAVLVCDGVNACMDGEGWLSGVVDLVVVRVEVSQQYACVLGIIFLEVDATTPTLLADVSVGVGG